MYQVTQQQPTSEQVDQWILEEDLPARAHLKPIRMFDELVIEDEDERQAYNEFIHHILTREHHILTCIPVQDNSNFWPVELDEFGDNISAFNTHDFAGNHHFSIYHWKLKEACRKVRDMAITYSIITGEGAKKRILNRFTTLAGSEYPSFIAKLFKVWNEHAYTD
jgi:hypothetical protein